MKRIYLIDCPGVVPPSNNDSPEDILLRGVVRVENVNNPEQYIPAVLKKAKPHHIERTYDVKGFSTATRFLELLARKGGRLLKGGEADVDGVAKMVLNDFLRGKIPWFTPPPVVDGEGKGIDGRKGALGEMGRISTLKDQEPGSQSGEVALDSDDIAESIHEEDGSEGDGFEGFDGGEVEDESMESSEGTESAGDGEILIEDGGALEITG